MKLICEISVFNRLAPNVKPRSLQSTLAIGYHPPGSTKDLENLFLIHFSSTNKVGTRYKIKRNVEKVFLRFIDDGKTTISIKQPPHDLHIKCDPTQLKMFLKIFKLALEGKYDANKLGLSTLAITGVPKKAIPLKKLSITSPADYPLHGLPNTLVTLYVNDIRKYSIDSQILSLSNLRILNMSNNRISNIPKRFGDLNLVELNLSNNCLEKATFKDWKWIDNPTIKSSLQTIDFSNNHLTYFPYKLVRLSKLFVLKLNNNNITKLPFGMRRLKFLRTLELAGNRIETLPNIMARMPLETIDLSGENMFTITGGPENSERPVVTEIMHQPSQLWQIAAKIVVTKRLKYGPGDLPTTLIDQLEECPICDCGKIFVPTKIYIRNCIIKLSAKNVIANGSATFYGDSVYCDENCRARYQRFYF